MAHGRKAGRLIGLLASLLTLCLAIPAAASAAHPDSHPDTAGPRHAHRRPARHHRHRRRKADASTTRPSLTIVTQTPSSGQTVSGSITWQVSVSGSTPSRVDFAVDGSVQWSQTTSPYIYGGVSGGLDTTKLSNGGHTLTATAYAKRGVKSSTSVKVTVANETSPAPSPQPEAETVGTTSSSGTPLPLYWGATIGSQLTGNQAPWDMSAVTKFEEETHKSVSLIQFFQPFANCSSTCSFYAFPKTPLENVRLHGSIPVLSWSSQSIPSSLNEPEFQLSDVINGNFDSYIRSFAEAAKAWGHPFFLRFDWEMNGAWFPWSEKANGNSAGQFVAAWRHVHDIFASVGATNATWVWCPNVDPGKTLQSLSSLYPGSEYVDWTGLDGYNWGTNPVKPGGWKTFDQIYRSTYREIVETIAPSKPMLIGEVASSEYGGSKAEWIKDMLARVPAEYPGIRGLLWFDKYDSEMDWPIETSTSATTAFAEGIQPSVYRGNLYGGLAPTTILPPS